MSMNRNLFVAFFMAAIVAVAVNAQTVTGNMSLSLNTDSDICSNLDLTFFIGPEGDSLEWSIGVLAAKGVTIRNIKIIVEDGDTKVFEGFKVSPADADGTMNRFFINSEVIHDMAFSYPDYIVKVGYMKGDEMKSITIKKDTIHMGLGLMWNFYGPATK